LLRVISLNEIETKCGRALLRIGVLDHKNSEHQVKVKTCIAQYINNIKIVSVSFTATNNDRVKL